ncbi:Ubiquitin carboxyl-terminal hydrolase 33 [Gossypium arboreum]|uniref:Ubiquitin carboxyl-terminal hydrolase 33 n=1 Tax=Gossypium arboreum TaxID=29729 RepID=A0A0B0NXE4_GOSAR|nr:Ubiquitin carboxyl-terminal hydrolase 33 [Gossypium arboreum]
MVSGPRSGKEQDFRLNRINCPYFVPSECMNDTMVNENKIMNGFGKDKTSRKSRASLVCSTGGWVARHVLRVPSACVSNPSSYVLIYRQASSRIEGRRRLNHTIN